MTAKAKKKKSPEKPRAKKKKEEKPKEPEHHHAFPKGDVPTSAVVGSFADVIEDYYREWGSKLDRPNAEDKALVIVRNLRYGGDGMRFRDREIKIPLCKQHRE